MDLARREKQLSQNFQELENYVMCVIAFVRRTKAKKVHLVGDSQVALGWIESCAPTDAHANELIQVLIEAQLSLGFVLTVEHKARNEKCIQCVDKLSKGDVNTMQVMDVSGYVRMP